MTMTPQQISDYKQKWMKDGGYAVRMHSDLRNECKTWCKKLEKHQWVHKPFTDVYEDTFYFEDKHVSQVFHDEFIRWANG
jgi:Leu/Phe-tRNA-protein transferase